MSKVTKKGKGKKGKKDKEQKTEEKKKEFQEIIGFGKFEFQNKIVYIGAYKQLKSGQKVREGYGKIIHPTSTGEIGKEYYEGEWKNDMMDGFGIYHYSNGDVYEGDWKNNMQHGRGKYYFTDGFTYEGEWREHQIHGTGKYLDLKNFGFSGEFRDGNYFSKEQAKLKEEKRINKKILKIKLIPFQFYKTWEETISKIDTKTVHELLSPFFGKNENMGLYFQGVTFPLYDDYKPEYWDEALRWLFGQPAKKLKIPEPKKVVKKKGNEKSKKKVTKEEEKKLNEEEAKKKIEEEESKKKLEEEAKKKLEEEGGEEKNEGDEDKEEKSEDNPVMDIPKNESGTKMDINVPKNGADLLILNKDALLMPQLQDDLSSGQVIEIKGNLEEREIKMVIAFNRDLNRWLIIYWSDNQAPEKEKKKTKKSKGKKKTVKK